jgi:hypothetical protein
LSRTVSDPFDPDDGAPRMSADCGAKPDSDTSVSVSFARAKPTVDGSAVLCPSDSELG